MGRAEIARSLSLSTQAVSNIIADLKDDGFLVEMGRVSAGRGLPAVQYAVNPGGGYAFGIEIRPDAVFAALLDLQGHIITTLRRKLSDPGPEVVLKTVVELRDAAIKNVPDSGSRMLGVGIVMPGPVGTTGISDLSTDLHGWQEVDAHMLFADALGMPTEVNNDANAAAMAEQVTGVAKGLSTYAYLYFGAGLGLGLVSNGQLISGAFGNAGEIGHIPVLSGGRTLESALSRLSVQRYLNAAGKNADDFTSLERLFAERDSDILDWLDQACDALSRAVGIVENLFDPQTIVLGGAMPGPMLEYLARHTYLPDVSVSHRPNADHPRLTLGATGRLTATLGAAALVLNNTLTPLIAHTN